MTALSTRQREGIILAAGGLTNPAIAQKLGITLGTVKNHMDAVRRKLGATNRRHAVRLAVASGELS